MKLLQKIDKERVKAVLQSLRHFNQQLLQQNGINEKVDDTIFVNIKFKKTIEIHNPNTKGAALGGQSVVQIALPHSIKKTNILLLVKEGETRKYQTVVEESNIGI